MTDDERDAAVRARLAGYDAARRDDPTATAGPVLRHAPADLAFLLGRLDAAARARAALEAALRELSACWEGCDNPACCAGGGPCGRCATREHAAREAARRLLGGGA